MNEITIGPGRGGQPVRLSLEESAELTGMHPQMILAFVQASFVQAAELDRRGAPRFDERGLLRLRSIEEMRTRHRVSLRTIRSIVHLLDRLEVAERELRILRERLR